MNNKRRAEFLGLPGPKDYIGGIGRGANGFTTRSDIGPARDSTDAPDDRHHQFKQNRDEDENENLNDNDYDEFSGYSGNTCARDPYEEDDAEADLIYENIESHMEDRRKVYKEKKLLIETEEYRRKRPKIQQEFSDLKRQLNTVSMEEWMNIPEVGDGRNRNERNPRQEAYVPKPDSLIADQFSQINNQMTSFDPRSCDRYANPTGNIDLQKIGKARTTLMDCELDKVNDSITGQTVIDPKGYLTDLHSLLPQNGSSANDIADNKRCEDLLRSIIVTNPKKVHGWIAMIRFLESRSKVHEAKQNVMKGCENCPENEEMWLEAIRIMKEYGGNENKAQAKSIAARAIRNVPESVTLWIAAANLEESVQKKREVFRKALTHVPNSVKLWKLTVELEEANDAVLLLKAAVECCPESTELWLALAKLSIADEARKILNEALGKIPNDRRIWLTGCQLEEREGNINKVEMMVKRALQTLKSNGVEINRYEWIKDAEDSELCGYKITAKKIIQRVIEIGIEEQDRKSTWIDDAESCIKNGCYECARAIYGVCTVELSNKKSVWKKAAVFEKEHGNRESYEDILSRAVEIFPNFELLWLMAAKSKWEAGDVDGSRNTLSNGFTNNPNSEEIMLAAVKLESENNEFERARKLLQKARTSVGKSRVWMKSARLEWCLDDLNSAETLLLDGVSRFPNDPKLWIMLGQLRHKKGKVVEALCAYKEGSRENPSSIPLWTLQANLEETFKSIGAARNTLEKARSKNIKVPELWLACVRLEMRHGNTELANNLLSRSLQHCSSSGILWAETINIAEKNLRKNKAQDAVRKCEHSEHVILAAAKTFWEMGRYDKVRSWLMNSIKAEKLFGDAWAYLYKFDSIYGTEEQKEEVIQRCMLAEPRFGEYWCSVSKDVSNWKLKTKDILPLVAQKVPLPL